MVPSQLYTRLGFLNPGLTLVKFYDINKPNNLWILIWYYTSQINPMFIKNPLGSSFLHRSCSKASTPLCGAVLRSGFSRQRAVDPRAKYVN